jgi:hypothetical protein
MSSAQDRPSGTAGPGTTGSGEPTTTGGPGQTGAPGQTGVPGQRGGPPRPGYQEGYREGYRGETAEGYRGETAEYGRAEGRGMEGRGEGHGVAAMAGHVLASALMIFAGLVTIFIGITGIIRGTFFLAVPNYTYYFSPFGRGVTDLIIGAVVLAAGVCLLMGMMWARAVGVALAVIMGVANFLFLPYAPLWSIVVIALSIFIIWALTTGGRHRYA